MLCNVSTLVSQAAHSLCFAIHTPRLFVSSQAVRTPCTTLFSSNKPVRSIGARRTFSSSLMTFGEALRESDEPPLFFLSSSESLRFLLSSSESAGDALRESERARERLRERDLLGERRRPVRERDRLRVHVNPKRNPL